MLYLVSDSKILIMSSQHDWWWGDVKKYQFLFLHTNVSKCKVENRSEKRHNFPSKLDIKSRFWDVAVVSDPWQYHEMMEKYILKAFQFTVLPVSLVSPSNVGLKELIYLCCILSTACSTWHDCCHDAPRWLACRASVSGSTFTNQLHPGVVGQAGQSARRMVTTNTPRVVANLWGCCINILTLPIPYLSNAPKIQCFLSIKNFSKQIFWSFHHGVMGQILLQHSMEQFRSWILSESDKGEGLSSPSRPCTFVWWNTVFNLPSQDIQYSQSCLTWPFKGVRKSGCFSDQFAEHGISNFQYRISK